METVFLSLSKSDFQDLIAETVNACLRRNTQDKQPAEADRWFDISELCAYHPDKPAKPTVYSWVNSGLIPVHKSGKKLRFLKSEIDNWLKQGKKKSTSDINAEANNYLTRKQK